MKINKVEGNSRNGDDRVRPTCIEKCDQSAYVSCHT